MVKQCLEGFDSYYSQSMVKLLFIFEFCLTFKSDQYNFRDIIARIGFSGVLGIDEYKPTRAKHYDLIAVDAIKWHILFIRKILFLYLLYQY